MRSILVNSALALASIMAGGMEHDRMVKVSPTLRRRAGWQERAVDKRYRQTGKLYDGHAWAPDSEVWQRAEAKRTRKAKKLQRDYDRCVQLSPVALWNAEVKRGAVEDLALYLGAQPVSELTEEQRRNRVAPTLTVGIRPMGQHAVYCGSKKKLQGKTALVQPYKREGYVLAQFDDLELSFNKVRLAFGWHEFQADEFKVV